MLSARGLNADSLRSHNFVNFVSACLIGEERRRKTPAWYNSLKDTGPMTRLVPTRKVPRLEFPMLDGSLWRLEDQSPKNFSMIVFYRGLHCPICGRYLKDLDNRLQSFEDKGVGVVVVSGDTKERATQAYGAWHLERVPMGHSLPLDMAHAWGLYTSSGIGTTSAGVEEPAQFSEPGLFLVKPDGTLYYGNVQTMPFARPAFAELLGALDFAIAKNYPARGELG